MYVFPCEVTLTAVTCLLRCVFQIWWHAIHLKSSLLQPLKIESAMVLSMSLVGGVGEVEPPHSVMPVTVEV